MKYVKLAESERSTLKEAYKNHSKPHVRERAHALLLSNAGTKIKFIAPILNVRTRTIYTWMDRWEEMGIVGIMTLPGQGRPPLLSITDNKIVEAVKKKHSSVPEV